jgi:tetratricopeptide (TPR) repeat protein
MRCILAGVLALLAALAAPARAGERDQAPPTPATRERAKALFEEAEGYYRVREYEKALASYKESYLLAREPVLLFNIAQCYRQLGQLEEALKSYEAFLRDDPKSALRENAAARLAEIRDEIARRATRGAIDIKTRQDPAEVFLDGEPKGSSPLVIQDVEPGEHRLALRKAGFVEYAVSLKVLPGETVSLTAPPLVVIEQGLSRPGLLYAAGGLGGLSAASALASLALARRARAAQAGLSADVDGDGTIEESDLTALRDDPAFRAVRLNTALAKILGHAATGLFAGAALSGAAGIVLGRRAKTAEVAVTPAPGGLSVTVRY